MWGPLILALVQWLGPILFEAFKAWLERRLREKAKTVPARVLKFGGTAEDDKIAKLFLLRAVRGDLWFWQLGKKRAVDQCIAAVESDKLPITASLVGHDAV